MLTMQYSFTLPADYDMGIIRKRISDKGRLMDGFGGLAFKAFLYADRGEGYSSENLYAPFYLWNDTVGMRHFLSSKGFESLVQAFGWPIIRTWVPVAVANATTGNKAAWATRELAELPAHTSLEIVESEERENTEKALQRGAVLAVSGYEPTTWTRMRFRLWSQLEITAAVPKRQVYRVGYLATKAPAP